MRVNLQSLCSNVIFLMVLVTIGLAVQVRSLEDSTVPLLVLYLFMFIIHIFFALMRNKVSRAEFMPLIYLFVWLSVFAYSLLVSLMGGFGIKEGIGLYVRFFPLLLIPIIALHIHSKFRYYVLIIAVVIEGTLGALVDLKFTGNTHEIVRLMNEDYISVDYFYSLLTCLYIIIFSNHSFLWKLMAIVPVFIIFPRLVMAVSRGEIALLFAFLALAFVINLRKYIDFKRLVSLLAAIFVLSAFALKFVDKEALMPYFKLLSKRSEHTESSMNYRVAELKAALSYGGIIGDGISSKRDFSAALQYTSSARAIGVKAYVHEFIGFFLWKFGWLVGGLFLVILMYWVFSAYRSIPIVDDDLFNLSFLILIIFLAHSMVNLYFLRVEAYTIVLPFFSYLFWKAVLCRYSLNYQHYCQAISEYPHFTFRR